MVLKTCIKNFQSPQIVELMIDFSFDHRTGIENCQICQLGVKETQIQPNMLQEKRKSDSEVATILGGEGETKTVDEKKAEESKKEEKNKDTEWDDSNDDEIQAEMEKIIAALQK